MARLKSWRIFRRSRSSPNRMTSIAEGDPHPGEATLKTLSDHRPRALDPDDDASPAAPPAVLRRITAATWAHDPASPQRALPSQPRTAACGGRPPSHARAHGTEGSHDATDEGIGGASEDSVRGPLGGVRWCPNRWCCGRRGVRRAIPPSRAAPGVRPALAHQPGGSRPRYCGSPYRYPGSPARQPGVRLPGSPVTGTPPIHEHTGAHLIIGPVR